MSLPKNFYNAVDAKKMGLDDIDRMKSEIDSMIGLPDVTAADVGKTLVVSDSGSWELGEAGGNITFTKTIIAENLVTTPTPVVFTDNYFNYDFVEIELLDTYDHSRDFIFVTTPHILEIIFNVSSNKCCFNYINTNVYVTVSESRDPDTNIPTWTVTNQRYLVVKQVRGIKASKKPRKTSIYTRKSIGSGSVQPGSINFNDYDLVFFASCTGDDTETCPCFNVFRPYGNLEKDIYFSFNRYNNISPQIMTDGQPIPANWYLAIIGYKF